MSDVTSKPRWIRDLVRFLPLRSQFVLSGNVRDQYPLKLAPAAPAHVLPLVTYVATELRQAGVGHFIAYDPAQGFSLPTVIGVDRKTELEFFMKLEVPVSETGASPASPERFFEVLERIVRWPGDPIAVFADFASRLLLRPDLPTETEQRL